MDEATSPDDQWQFRTRCLIHYGGLVVGPVPTGRAAPLRKKGRWEPALRTPRQHSANEVFLLRQELSIFEQRRRDVSFAETTGDRHDAFAFEFRTGCQLSRRTEVGSAADAADDAFFFG